jgi:hypothetical protein
MVAEYPHTAPMEGSRGAAVESLVDSDGSSPCVSSSPPGPVGASSASSARWSAGGEGGGRQGREGTEVIIIKVYIRRQGPIQSNPVQRYRSRSRSR